MMTLQDINHTLGSYCIRTISLLLGLDYGILLAVWFNDHHEEQTQYILKSFIIVVLWHKSTNK